MAARASIRWHPTTSNAKSRTRLAPSVKNPPPHETQFAAHESRLVTTEFEDTKRVRFTARHDAVADVHAGSALAVSPLDELFEGAGARRWCPHERPHLRIPESVVHGTCVRGPEFTQGQAFARQLRQPQLPVS
jgi:hypothetical protein